MGVVAFALIVSGGEERRPKGNSMNEISPIVPAGGHLLDIWPEPSELPGLLTAQDIDIVAEVGSSRNDPRTSTTQ
jgi:hypothetical protein